MSAISQYITQIQNAVYGEQVRGAIVSALEACYSDVENPDLQSAAFLEAIEEAYESGILDITEVTQVSQMTNENIIYRYMGTQAGYIANTLYYHNGTAWVPLGSGVMTASTAAQMTNQSAIYKYTGTESGYTQNALYYFDGTSWIPLSNQHVQEEIDSLDTRVSNLESEGGVFFQKTLSVYGDSLTEANSHYSVGYYTWIKNILGFSSVANYGVSGYTTENVYNKINEITNETDVISIMCGVNDQTFNVPLGTPSDTTTGTTYGNVYKICELVKTKYPTSIIFFITPHFQTKYPHSGGVTSYEISRAIIEVCTKFSVPVYDNFVFSGLCSSNLSTFTTDGCHWNNLGHEMVGKNIAKWLDDSFRYVYPHGGGGGGGDVEEWEGYTMSITGGYQGAVHLVQLIDTQNLSVGDAVDCTITCHSASAEITTPSAQGSTPAYFGDTTGEVGNSAFSGQYGGCNTTVSHVGSSYIINSSFTVLANSLGNPYIKTINRLSYATPFSFVIDSVVVKANNTQIPVEKFGTFFTQETFTLTAPN